MHPPIVYEAPSLGELFRETKTLEENESVSLGVDREAKIMVHLHDAAQRCNVLVPTVISDTHFVVMILGKGAVALYRISMKKDTLDRVPILVDFLKKEIPKITGKNATESGYRIILASRENESDREYQQIHNELGQKLQAALGYLVVTCYQYQDGSVLHAAFIGQPDGWPSCCEEMVEASRTTLTKINYLDTKLGEYSLDG
ncbi:hypothetical protein PISL3812_06565 [Talaromyces islandicus]|uniref:Uncharacterized protein n=1 Tax=Talaromyces islandicus TaxID=28573 RepID=A0A0U1M1X0_TALIS|nr:hypothetical protein PISL3812_06565 [Talaromyces islandicus]